MKVCADFSFISLLGNRIGDLGARAMAQCLHTNARLVKLK